MKTTSASDGQLQISINMVLPLANADPQVLSGAELAPVYPDGAVEIARLFAKSAVLVAPELQVQVLTRECKCKSLVQVHVQGLATNHRGELRP